MAEKIEPPQRLNPEEDLQQLKQLLFDQELLNIEELRQHCLEPQQRAIDTAEVLVDSINLAAQDPQRLVSALNAPVDECIRSIVASKPQAFADSLFPVMGPAIRKSISETLKTFVQSTNQMIEHSMSPRSIGWRWEAKRSGVPFSEIILKHSLLYRVEEVFLIQQGTGVLIEHVSHPDVAEHDSDAISAMLTVIRDFSRDSFSADASDGLQTVEFGERTLWMFDGPQAMLACVNRGLVPKSNRTQLQSVLEQFHALYAEEIAQFSGDREQHPQWQALLSTCLTQQSKEADNEQASAEKSHWLRKPLSWILLAALLLAGYWFWQNFNQQRRTTALLAELESMSGVVVIDAEKSADGLLIKGLKDPLVAPFNALANKHGFSEDKVQFQMGLYQSLDAPLALQRATQLLDAPDSVVLQAKDQQLLATGSATQQWLDFAHKISRRIPGFDRLNLDQVTLDQESRLHYIRQQLAAPASVSFSLDNNNLLVTGTAPVVWIDQLKQLTAQQLPDLTLQTNDAEHLLSAEEFIQAQVLQKELNGSIFYFSESTTLITSEQGARQQLFAKITQLLGLLKRLNLTSKLVLTGYADASGNQQKNHLLKLKRAELIKQQLIQRGAMPTAISMVAAETSGDAGSPDHSFRKVEIEIEF